MKKYGSCITCNRSVGTKCNHHMNTGGLSATNFRRVGCNRSFYSSRVKAVSKVAIIFLLVALCVAAKGVL